MGDWDAAVAAADGLVAQPRLANAVARIPALEVTGLVALRRGQPGRAGTSTTPGSWPARRARCSGCRPIACARAEAAWLEGDAAAVDAATRDALALALDVGHEWDVGELRAVALPRRAAGRRAGVVPAPDRVRARRRCPRRRAALGRAGRAVRPGGRPAGRERTRAAARRDRAARPARRDRRGRPRARSAAPRRRQPRPAWAASRDARQPGRPDRPPARGARARGAGAVEPGDRAAAVPVAQDRRAPRRGDAGQARRALAARRRERRAPARHRAAQFRGAERPSWGRVPDARDAPGGRSVGSSADATGVHDDRDRRGRRAQGAPSRHVGFGRLPDHGGDVPAAARPPARLRRRHRPRHARARRRRRHGQRVAARGAAPGRA